MTNYEYTCAALNGNLAMCGKPATHTGSDGHMRCEAHRLFVDVRARASDPLRDSFIAAATPLIKWLNENWLHPHHTVIVTQTGAELMEGSVAHKTMEFVKD